MGSRPGRHSFRDWLSHFEPLFNKLSLNHFRTLMLSKIAARYQITAVKVAIDRAPRGKFSCPISQPDHIPFLAVQGLKFSPVIGWRSQVANWPKSLLAYLP